MTDLSEPRRHACDELPLLLRVEGESILCGSCRRQWRIPADGRLSQDNFEYLCQHADTHFRAQRSRPPQTWRRHA